MDEVELISSSIPFVVSLPVVATAVGLPVVKDEVGEAEEVDVDEDDVVVEVDPPDEDDDVVEVDLPDEVDVAEEVVVADVEPPESVCSV